ncbi:MAG: RHS repeat-associated core domain-containing protein, partial [Patescibacteria group bacterium]|nr:RHS repeat-associated core domain-containing protein [Patescibacteria group bacterium]
YAYDAYGTLAVYSASFTPNAASVYAWPYTYTARRLDEETGLMYYRARYYHAELGRFVPVSRDPIGYTAGVNTSRYVSNRPIQLSDPVGLLEAIPYPDFLDEIIVIPGFHPPLYWDPDPTCPVSTVSHTGVIYITQHVRGNEAAMNSHILHEWVAWLVEQTTGERDYDRLTDQEYAPHAFSNLAQLALARQTGWGCSTATEEHAPHRGAEGKVEYRAARAFFDKCCAFDESVRGQTMYVTLESCSKGIGTFFWRSCVRGFFRLCCNSDFSVDGNMRLATWSGNWSVKPSPPMPVWWPSGYELGEAVQVHDSRKLGLEACSDCEGGHRLPTPGVQAKPPAM